MDLAFWPAIAGWVAVILLGSIGTKRLNFALLYVIGGIQYYANQWYSRFKYPNHESFED